MTGAALVFALWRGGLDYEGVRTGRLGQGRRVIGGPCSVAKFLWNFGGDYRLRKEFLDVVRKVVLTRVV